MKKLFVMLLAVCAVNLHAVNVYVGGVVMDGSDRTPAYWLNGTMHFLSLYEPMPEGSRYGSMAVENGSVYMCIVEKGRNYRQAHVYKEGGDEIGDYISVADYGEINLSVVNGKAYLGARDVYSSHNYHVYKNGRSIGCNNCGEHMIAKDGALYYTTELGYSAGGYEYRVNSFNIQCIRVINGNLYMMGNDSKGACVQTNNTRRDYIEGYGKICKDMAIVNGQYFYIMDNRLINQNGASILSNSYIPLQIIGHGSQLYILYKGTQGAMPEHFVGIYDPSANRISNYYKLPSCVSAYDFYIEN